MSTPTSRFADLDAVDYTKYKTMVITRPDPDLPSLMLIELNRPDKFNATNARMHREASQVWLDIHRDPTVSVVVLTGKGKAFCAGGDLEMIDEFRASAEALYATYDEARAIVRNMVDCDKVIIAAINGVAVGAGCALALMADVTIAAENARFGDGHIKLGVAAGDHAVAIWPLLCGMAKAKYYALTGEMIDAKEAERIGLVSKMVPKGESVAEAMRVARGLARGPQHAIKHTKRAFNVWLNQSGGPAFDVSSALEMLDFQHGDAAAGLAALRRKGAPEYPSAAAVNRRARL